MASIDILNFGIVLLVGVPGALKEQFIRKHFHASEVVHGTSIAGVGDMSLNGVEALSVMETIVDARLGKRLLTVIDAPFDRIADREHWVRFASKRLSPASAIVLEVSPQGDDPNLRAMYAEMRKAQSHMPMEGYSALFGVSARQIGDVAVRWAPLPADRQEDRGPFDIIGDIHGCADQLEDLLVQLGYHVSWRVSGHFKEALVRHPENRKAVLVGDIADRGPRVADSYRLAMAIEDSGGYCVCGNHDDKLRRWFDKPTVKQMHGLHVSIVDIEAQKDPGFKPRLKSYLDRLPDHLCLDGGDLVVAHAGIKEHMIGRAGGVVREFCLYGEKAGHKDGQVVRIDWAKDYRGDTSIVYGHTPTRTPQWINNTICVDGGCVFGGSLAAVRWPERNVVCVPAGMQYWERNRPFIGDEAALDSSSA